jgi:hypothetical protein
LPYTDIVRDIAAYLTMLPADSVFVGVDPTATRKAFTYAALHQDLSVLSMAEGELEDVLDLLANHAGALVAVNSPSHLNAGLVRQSQEGDGPAGRHLRGTDLRVAEHELRAHGISVAATPSREAACPAWIRVGLSLFRGLAERGFEPLPSGDCPRQWLETHPHAAFTALLGRVPLSRATIEGRLQRQLVLHERGVRIHDPMLYFEEITRHRLLNGILPAEGIYLPEQLDALVAAFTAWCAAERATELTRVGHDSEGYISLPVSVLKEKY